MTKEEVRLSKANLKKLERIAEMCETDSKNMSKKIQAAIVVAYNALDGWEKKK